MANKKTDANPPAAELTDGSVKAVIWRNETRNGPQYSVSLSRLYTDSEGAWQESRSFNASDLGNVAFIVARANMKIAELKEADKETRAA